MGFLKISGHGLWSDEECWRLGKSGLALMGLLGGRQSRVCVHGGRLKKGLQLFTQDCVHHTKANDLPEAGMGIP